MQFYWLIFNFFEFLVFFLSSRSASYVSSFFSLLTTPWIMQMISFISSKKHIFSIIFLKQNHIHILNQLRNFYMPNTIFLYFSIYMTPWIMQMIFRQKNKKLYTKWKKIWWTRQGHRYLIYIFLVYDALDKLDALCNFIG